MLESALHTIEERLVTYQVPCSIQVSSMLFCLLATLVVFLYVVARLIVCKLDDNYASPSSVTGEVAILLCHQLIFSFGSRVIGI